MSASASRDDEGRIHITLAHLDPNQARTVTATIRGQDVANVSDRILTADRMNAHNTFEQPNMVQPASFDGAELSGETLTVQLPPKALVVLELQ